jgi:glutathione S-transferase
LDWHHGNTRRCGILIFGSFFAPMLGIKPVFNMEEIKKSVEESLKFIENYFLKEKKFIFGQD